jgi:membrane protease YdiL (CAAX protease family)
MRQTVREKQAPRMLPGKPIRYLALGLVPIPLVWASLSLAHSAILAFLLYHGYCLYVGRLLGGPIRARRLLLTQLAGYLFGSLAVCGIAVLAYPFLASHLFSPQGITSYLASVGISRHSLPWLIPYFVIVNPLAEELFWRAMLQETVLPRLGRMVTVPTVAALFALWHAVVIARFFSPPLVLLSLLGIFLAGLYLGSFYRQENPFMRSVLVHAVLADLPLLVLLSRMY